MSDIEKIKYSISYFDVDTMAVSKKSVYEIYPDGRVVLRRYQSSSRKCIRKSETTTATTTATTKDYSILCNKLSDCVSSADQEEQYIDDTVAEVKVYYSSGKIDTIPRGYGNNHTNVGNIVCEYLVHKAGMDI